MFLQNGTKRDRHIRRHESKAVKLLNGPRKLKEGAGRPEKDK